MPGYSLSSFIKR